MDNTPTLARSIKDKSRKRLDLRIRSGVVTVVNGGSPPTVDINLGNCPTQGCNGLRYFDWYTPSVDDTVWVIIDGPNYIVLGKLAE